MLRLAGAALAVVLASCACKPHPKTAGGDGMGTGTGAAPVGAADCDGVKPAVTALYDADGKASGASEKDASYVEDNVAMVMADCAKEPARVVPCAKAAKSVPELEQGCLIPLDEEGTEGERIER